MNNLPNILTIIRLATVPVIAYSFYKEKFILALALYLFACITDVVDGFIARKYNLITELGKALDPLADKLVSLTVIICMGLYNMIPLWVSGMFLLKEGIMVISGLFLYKKNIVIASNWYGKAATVVTSVSVAIILIFKDTLNDVFKNAIIIIALSMAIFALIRYTINFFKNYKLNNNINMGN
ncbi:MAG: CDP-alcohol phosphatidyltransferase family protein [Clostridiaceae bacterium]|nr:CDP-alcohol phosphatidyltransferase family protein [Clostridiaceae bacterium]